MLWTPQERNVVMILPTTWTLLKWLRTRKALLCVKVSLAFIRILMTPAPSARVATNSLATDCCSFREPPKVFSHWAAASAMTPLW